MNKEALNETFLVLLFRLEIPTIEPPGEYRLWHKLAPPGNSIVPAGSMATASTRVNWVPALPLHAATAFNVLMSASGSLRKFCSTSTVTADHSSTCCTRPDEQRWNSARRPPPAPRSSGNGANVLYHGDCVP